jgi:hypothetical protein
MMLPHVQDSNFLPSYAARSPRNQCGPIIQKERVCLAAKSKSIFHYPDWTWLSGPKIRSLLPRYLQPKTIQSLLPCLTYETDLSRKSLACQIKRMESTGCDASQPRVTDGCLQPSLHWVITFNLQTHQLLACESKSLACASWSSWYGDPTKHHSTTLASRRAIELWHTSCVLNPSILFNSRCTNISALSSISRT